MASEKLLEANLRKGVTGLKGECIKLLPSLMGLPDRIVLMHGGRIWFVELKTTGRKPQPLQRWWKTRLEALGFEWRLIDDETSLNNFIQELQ